MGQSPPDLSTWNPEAIAYLMEKFGWLIGIIVVAWQAMKRVQNSVPKETAEKMLAASPAITNTLPVDLGPGEVLTTETNTSTTTASTVKADQEN